VNAMASYIGTATSRVDGRAKVTGEAKYAGEFNVPGIVHGYVVEATIPRGRIAHIDTSAALGLSGVIDVLTHRNRPPMADKDEAYKDEVAPEKGSPYRPLYPLRRPAGRTGAGGRLGNCARRRLTGCG
jgi:xanthine dehydrogenase YagR molybdenum-binding subunit